MRRIRISTLLLLLATMLTATAESINENQAREIASSFLASHAMPTTSLKMAHKAPRLNSTIGQSGQAAYYVFNANQGGYVIVAGDDRAPAVLGYSDDGTFDSQNVPEAMQELLEGYTAQIQALTLGAKPALRATPAAAIRPLVTANWAQREPFNLMLPTVVSGKRAAAGCVATALAQVLYYWKQPTTCNAIPEYTSRSLGIYMPALDSVNFNWQAMHDIYLSTDTESEGALAVAQLTLYCAQALKMDFMYNASGASSTRIPYAISSYFGYKASAHNEHRESFTAQGWNDLIYNELAEGRPVIYSGSKASGGHSFICDGYDGQGMFHINWGWGGMSNGYFLLNVLNPDTQSTGGANGAYGYILDQSIVAGIEPGESEKEYALTAKDVTLNSAVTTRSSSNADFQVTVSGRFYNYSPWVMNVYLGWGLYQGDELVSSLGSINVNGLPSAFFWSTDNTTLKFGKGITSGTYRIVPNYREVDVQDWHLCKGADVNYIEVTIDGDECTVIGKGSAGATDYTINDITCDGSLHHGSTVHLTLSVTNNGYSQNDMLYMFVNGTSYSTAYLGLEHGETGDIPFQFVPTTAGAYTCTFSLNEDGSDPIGQTTLNITEMPAADLSISYEVLNVTEAKSMIVTSDKFSLKLTITNNGTETYNDDIKVRLYRRLNGNSGNFVQMMNQFTVIDPGQSVVTLFDLDNVADGQDYFAAIYYYSEGEAVMEATTYWYTIVFPTEQPEVLIGDVNDDQLVNITDVTILIDYLLGSGTINEVAADVTQSDGINISDVAALIDLLLGGGN